MAEIKWTEAQRAAIDADGCSLAVAAAAGSGKTAVLTRRIIERIRDGKADISRMLVVTFTRAAAAEVESRIGEELSKLSALDPSDKRIARQLLLLPSAEICTIDSFCLDLIRQNFTDTGISGFSVTDAETEKMIMEDVMEELITDYFDGNVGKDGQIEDFGTFYDTVGSPSSDTAFCRAALDIYDKYTVCVDREKAICGDGDDKWWDKILNSLNAGFDHYLKIFSDALDEIDSTEGAENWRVGFNTDKTFVEEVSAALKKRLGYSEIKGIVNDYPNRKVTLKAVKSSSKTPRLVFFSEMRKEFVAYVKKISEKFFGYDEETVNFIFDETKKMRRKMCVFLDEYDRRLTAEKKRRRVMSFSDIERIAFEMLYDRKTGGASNAAHEIAERFDDVYIDEYQDTNEIQDMIFTLISRDDNRFTVGDIKQSIYDFRGADPSLFLRQLDAREKYGAGETKQAKLFLSENFRSSGAIIDFVNGVFDTVMNEDGKIRYGKDERLYCGRKDIENKKPEIKFVCRGDNGEITETEYVARRIEKMICEGEAKPDEIAVLMKKNDGAAEMEKALKARRIPCKNTATEEFFMNAEILLAISILNTVDNPSRDVYLAGALKSPVYGVKLDELMFIRRYKKDGTLFSALKAFTDENEFQKGKKFLSDHEKFRQYAKVFTCAEAVRRIFADTHIMSLATVGKSAAESENSRANLQKLYDYAREYEKGGDKRLYGFIKFLDELSTSKAKVDVSQFSKSAGAVKLMTVHGSKGLEFKVCFLINSTNDFFRKEAADDVVCPKNAPMAMRIIKDGVKLDTPMRESAIDAIFDRHSDEDIRLLYVALTRAKEKLIITGGAKDEGKARAWYDFNTADSSCTMAAEYFSGFARKNIKNFAQLICIAMSKTPDLCKEEFITEFEEVTSTATERNEEEKRMTAVGAKRDIKCRLDFEYPYRVLAGVPSKLSVSKLYPDVLDDDDGSAELEEKELTVDMPNFLKDETDDVSAAEHGTAMHTFMQFFDFANVDKNGVENEIRRLAENKLIFESDAQMLDAKKLDAFFGSSIAGQMRQARALYREKRFLVYYPAERFSEEDETKASLAGEKLLVQGVIDCAFINSAGELILVDYKTDSFSDDMDERFVANILRKRHRRQLEYYKYACEKLFGQSVAHTYIYSFALDGTVEL